MTLTHPNIIATVSLIFVLVTLLMLIKERLVSQASPISESPYAMVLPPISYDGAIGRERVVGSSFLDCNTGASTASGRHESSSRTLNPGGIRQNLDVDSIDRSHSQLHNPVQTAESEQSHTEILGQLSVESQQHESLTSNNASVGCTSDKTAPEVLVDPASRETRLLSAPAIGSWMDEMRTTSEAWSRQKPQSHNDPPQVLAERVCEPGHGDTVSLPPSSSSQFRVDLGDSEAMPMFATDIEWDVTGVGSWSQPAMEELEISVMDFLQE